MDDDGFRYLFSWLDVGCICKLDIAIGSADERSLWLHNLHMIGNKAVDDYNHSHESIRWLIRRGVRATRILIGGPKLARHRITDETFAGIGILSTRDSHINNSNNISNIHGSNIVRSDSTGRDRLRSRDVATDRNTGVSVTTRGDSFLTSIDLGDCCNISDIGLSAIAEGCPRLTAINLYNCVRISDIGLTAIVQGCHHLEFINLSDCDRISYVGVSAIAEGCRHLTTIDIYDRLTQEQLSIIKSNYPHLRVNHN